MNCLSQFSNFFIVSSACRIFASASFRHSKNALRCLFGISGKISSPSAIRRHCESVMQGFESPSCFDKITASIFLILCFKFIFLVSNDYPFHCSGKRSFVVWSQSCKMIFRFSIDLRQFGQTSGTTSPFSFGSLRRGASSLKS